VKVFTSLLAIVAIGCLPRPHVPEPEPEPGPPVVFGEHVEPVAEDPALPLAPITPGECPAEVGMVPTALFEERVLVRLPAGLDDSNFVEVGPYLARSSAAVAALDCRTDPATEATILAAALTLRPDDEVQSLDAVRDHAIAEFGYPSGYAILEGVSEPGPRRGMWVVEFSASDQSQTRALVVLKGSSGFMVALLYETRAESWPALVDSFVESGKRLLVVPG
jgi:hypothetical protein